MIAIKFSPKYEDRVSIYLKNSVLKQSGVEYKFTDTPTGEEKNMCYWLFTIPSNKLITLVLNSLVEMKEIMGVDDLKFSYCYNELEFYTQCSEYGSTKWFNI